MATYRLPYIALLGRVHGERRDRPIKRWIDNPTEDCNELYLNVVEACRLAGMTGTSDEGSLRVEAVRAWTTIATTEVK